MVKVNVKNGTPVGNAHLCRSCNWGQIVTGYRESDLLVLCTNASPNLVVPFQVLDCTEFADKYKPDWSQMEKLAIELKPVRVSARTRGFGGIAPAVLPGDEEEDEAVASGA
ncbi:MAG: hypothetical protein WCE75_03145 [Terracidiphilus sp.]